MKKYGTAIILAVVLAALVVPVSTTQAKPKDVIAEYIMGSPALLFPGVWWYDSVYQNEDHAGAEGGVIVTQPSNLKSATFDVAAQGLLPETVYTVYMDFGGYVPGYPSTIGSCSNMGTFTTDTLGSGSLHLGPATLPAGNYLVTILINYRGPGLHGESGNVNYTILLTDPMAVQINP